jgi:hypothetical protein
VRAVPGRGHPARPRLRLRRGARPRPDGRPRGAGAVGPHHARPRPGHPRHPGRHPEGPHPRPG